MGGMTWSLRDPDGVTHRRVAKLVGYVVGGIVSGMMPLEVIVGGCCILLCGDAVVVCSQMVIVMWLEYGIA